MLTVDQKVMCNVKGVSCCDRPIENYHAAVHLLPLSTTQGLSLFRLLFRFYNMQPHRSDSLSSSVWWWGNFSPTMEMLILADLSITECRQLIMWIIYSAQLYGELILKSSIDFLFIEFFIFIF